MGGGDNLKRHTNKAPFFHGEMKNIDEIKFQQARGPVSILPEELVTLPIATLRKMHLSIVEYIQASISMTHISVSVAPAPCHEVTYCTC